MAITQIRVSNFKSFKDATVKLGPFNVLVGANASGKSNLIQVLKFLRDIEKHGMDDAISMQGGIQLLQNITIASSEPLCLEVVCRQDQYLLPVLRIREGKREGYKELKVFESVYRLLLPFNKKGTGIKAPEESLVQKCEFFSVKSGKNRIREKDPLGQGEIRFSSIAGKLRVESVLPPDSMVKQEELPFPVFWPQFRLPRKSSILGMPYFYPQPIFADIPAYDFDPKLPKKGSLITGKVEMEEDGSNLAIVLKNLLSRREMKRKLSNLLADLLPFISDVSIEKFADKSLLFKLRETYANRYLPASVTSDGTISMVAILIALYFQRKPVIVVEEPERNIHPYLISRIVQMMRDASQKRQIIVTTHSPEVVKHAGLENLLLVSRDQKGFTSVSRPCEKEEVQTFLKNQMGVDELYEQNLLEI